MSISSELPEVLRNKIQADQDRLASQPFVKTNFFALIDAGMLTASECPYSGKVIYTTICPTE